MQKQNVGRRYGPVKVLISTDRARDLDRSLGIEAESVLAKGNIAAGIVPAIGGRELFAAMFDDITDDGIGNSSRRLAAGTEYYYDDVLVGNRDYWASGEILSVEEREGRTGRYQYGTLETAYAPEPGAPPILRVRFIFAERQSEVVQRSRPPSAEVSAELSGTFPEWIPPRYTNESILNYVQLVDDRNPNHRNDAYARSNGFPSRFASGEMTSHLLGEYVSRVCAAANVASVSFRLTQPIYPGQNLKINGRINREADPTGHRMEATLSADGRNVAFATAILRQAID